MSTGVCPGDTCHHCGTVHPVRLGKCSVCELWVCDHCGNTQRCGGERIAVHDSCLGRLEDDGFSMIRFVR